MSRVLDALQRIVSGGLMAATAVGLAAFGYGIYSFSVLRPRAKAAAAAAAEPADGAGASVRAPGGAALA
jgi:hypothetical protein